jgi:hypothetical protein
MRVWIEVTTAEVTTALASVVMMAKVLMGCSSLSSFFSQMPAHANGSWS